MHQLEKYTELWNKIDIMCIIVYWSTATIKPAKPVLILRWIDSRFYSYISSTADLVMNLGLNVFKNFLGSYFLLLWVCFFFFLLNSLFSFSLPVGPILVVEPRPVTVDVDSDVTLNCKWSGNPPLTLTWTKKGSSMVRTKPALTSSLTLKPTFCIHGPFRLWINVI